MGTQVPHRVIMIEPAAPAKPPLGAPCNGCGVCCLAEPCPVGIVVSRRRHGACAALRWSAENHRYVCGILVAPLGARTGRISRLFKRPLRALIARWISAGRGCDSDLELVRSASGQATRLALPRED